MNDESLGETHERLWVGILLAIFFGLTSLAVLVWVLFGCPRITEEQSGEPSRGGSIEFDPGDADGAGAD